MAYADYVNLIINDESSIKKCRSVNKYCKDNDSVVNIGGRM